MCTQFLHYTHTPLRILFCIDPGTYTYTCTQGPITYISTETPSHVLHRPSYTCIQGYPPYAHTGIHHVYVQRDIIHTYFQRLEHACAHKYPIIPVYAKVIHIYTESLSYVSLVYTETPFTHMHIKALSHMCTQEFHNHICVCDPCPNWYVHTDHTDLS